jgi:hypothetical protein
MASREPGARARLTSKKMLFRPLLFSLEPVAPAHQVEHEEYPGEREQDDL